MHLPCYAIGPIDTIIWAILYDNIKPSRAYDIKTLFRYAGEMNPFLHKELLLPRQIRHSWKHFLIYQIQHTQWVYIVDQIICFRPYGPCMIYVSSIYTLTCVGVWLVVWKKTTQGQNDMTNSNCKTVVAAVFRHIAVGGHMFTYTSWATAGIFPPTPSLAICHYSTSISPEEKVHRSSEMDILRTRSPFY